MGYNIGMKPLVAIFAHPDDESFGPSGRLALEAQKRDVYLICVTKGDAGENYSEEKKELCDIRCDELEKSAKILGIKKVWCLDFKDGDLCNNLYHDLARQITSHIEKIDPEAILTFEPHGVSGHIDHIVVAFVSRFIFEHTAGIKKLIYFCVPKEMSAQEKDYFIYFPDGYEKTDVQEVTDISSVWDKKVAAIKVHTSQQKDGVKMLSKLSELPKEEYFLVVNK